MVRLPITDVRCCTFSGTCTHSQSSWLLQRHPLWSRQWRYQKVAISTACCCPFGDWCPSERAYHADSSWCAPLAASQATDHIQDCKDGFQFVVRATYFVCWFRQWLDVPSYALHAMVTTLFWLRKRRHLAVTAFALLLLLFGTVYQKLIEANLLDTNISRGQFTSELITWLFGCAYT